MSINKIKQLFHESIKLKQNIVDSEILHSISSMGQIATKSIQNGDKLMLCGNGGSAADAQHLAAEMLVRLRPKIIDKVFQQLLWHKTHPQLQHVEMILGMTHSMSEWFHHWVKKVIASLELAHQEILKIFSAPCALQKR